MTQYRKAKSLQAIHAKTEHKHSKTNEQKGKNSMSNTYIFENTKGKAQKANNLARVPERFIRQYNKDLLFDFLLLHKHISNAEITESIEQQCFQYCTGISSRYIPVFKSCDIFTSFEYYTGNLYFKPYTVYSNSKNKRVYTIMRLAKIENLTFQERESVYSDYEVVKTIDEQVVFNNITEDIEIT